MSITCSLLVLFPFHLDPFFLASSSDVHLFSVCNPWNLIRIACHQSTHRRLLLERGQFISATPLKHTVSPLLQTLSTKSASGRGGAFWALPTAVYPRIHDEHLIDPVLCSNGFFHSVHLTLEGWG